MPTAACPRRLPTTGIATSAATGGSGRGAISAAPGAALWVDAGDVKGLLKVLGSDRLGARLTLIDRFSAAGSPDITGRTPLGTGAAWIQARRKAFIHHMLAETFRRRRRRATIIKRRLVRLCRRLLRLGFAIADRSVAVDVCGRG